MTNWIVTQTNLFKAAVTLRSISNFVSDDGTRDGAYGHERDFGGDIFHNSTNTGNIRRCITCRT